ncbi:hypothetical protein [Glaciecola petra]|uniref:Uncharacterized protein n=1 Tax=Glaciecola petra TaxID=3075602 RepID=A0ABU2ZN54_9ALTE|nr:hypothetical protein [Aestuariibacter sp. P117]MDT0594057.1 hypothetical protein [Aestuariibacter sp. P117]
MTHLVSLTKASILLCCIAVLGGCYSNTHSSPAEVIVSNASFERLDSTCVEQVLALQQAINSPSVSQYLSLANSAEHCLQDVEFSPKHPDLQTAMQFNALAVVNFVNAGDIQSAQQALDAFHQRFPQQDLLLNDFSSFVDTATALLRQHELTAFDLTMLNIAPSLRDEITRTRKWTLQ